jgi:hypothetical protein
MSSTPLARHGRFALRLVAGALAIFHGQLLWRRWADGTLGDGSIAARWLTAALLVLGLLWLQRRRGGVFRGREAAVLWILVALLHALAGIPMQQMLAAPAPWLAVPLGIVAARTIALALGRSVLLTPAPAALGPVELFAAPTPARRPAAVPGCRAPPSL